MAIDINNAKSPDVVVRELEVIKHLHTVIVAAGFQAQFEAKLGSAGLDNDFAGVVPLLTSEIEIDAIRILAEEFMLDNNIHGGAGTPDGEEADQVDFTFATASPLNLVDLAAGGRVTDVKIVIDTPFNGAAPTLEVGTIADSDLVLESGHNDPKTAGTYTNRQVYKVPAGVEKLRLIITPDGSTVGAGQVLFSVRR